MACVIGSQFLFMPTFLTHFCHFSLSQALWINTVNVLFFTCCVPFAGRLSDQLGRVPVILVGTLALMLISYPLYGLIDKQDLGMTLWALLAMGFFASLIVGPMGALLVSLFPTEVRTTGVAMTYNLSFAVFGGLAPLVLTTLQAWTQQGRSVSFYLLLCGFVALCALLSLVSPWRALERNSDALD
jgi:MHS family proline/betaine transporter-like MFS transporter